MEESTRQKKVAKLLQKELSDMLQKELKSLIPNTLITITVVRISPDLSSAKIYLSFLPEKNAMTNLELFRENFKVIRHALGNRIRHQVRIIPSLFFYLDDTEQEVLRIQNLLSTLEIPKEDDVRYKLDEYEGGDL